MATSADHDHEQDIESELDEEAKGLVHVRSKKRKLQAVQEYQKAAIQALQDLLGPFMHAWVLRSRIRKLVTSHKEACKVTSSELYTRVQVMREICKSEEEYFVSLTLIKYRFLEPITKYLEENNMVHPASWMGFRRQLSILIEVHGQTRKILAQTQAERSTGHEVITIFQDMVKKGFRSYPQYLNRMNSVRRQLDDMAQKDNKFGALLQTCATEPMEYIGSPPPHGMPCVYRSIARSISSSSLCNHRAAQWQDLHIKPSRAGLLHSFHQAPAAHHRIWLAPREAHQGVAEHDMAPPRTDELMN